MARPRSRSRPVASRPLLGKFLAVLFVVTCLLAMASAASSAQPSPRQEKDKAGSRSAAASSDDLICHTDVVAECYPRVFQPTHEFQRVHEDQDLPPGLHVRLNINTGLREAKINNESEELPEGLQGLPVDSSVVLVDQPEGANDIEVDAPVARIPKGAPAYDPAGVVKDPGAHADGEGSPASITFHESIALVKGVAVGQVVGHDADGKIGLAVAEQARFIDALVEIDDVAHDIYYGLKLTEDRVITRQLLCLMSGGSIGGGSIFSGAGHSGSGKGLEAAQKAAMAVASAVQNNPVALRELSTYWDMYKSGLCATAGGQVTTLGDVIFGPYHHATEDVPEHRQEGHDNNYIAANHPAWIRSRLLAISGLIKDKDIMQDFLSRGGLTEVLKLLVDHEGDAAYDAVRQRAANLVNDNFLDESMGADLSLWPVKEFAAAVAEKPCDGTVHAFCWDYHIQQLAKAHKKDKTHWSHGLLKGLHEVKKGGSGKTEL
ncbi:nucleotide exchange factor sil1 [Sporothrix stenoceras]|uniref:Nucleotide exchange factor sil1 n=1 Tax=Sporothrix stenoceras TaxID=5173 RepID=A0ABR3ZQZ2_9PEZI